MDLSPAGAAFLRANEGFVPRFYLDPVGIGTIGIGFTWASAAFQKWWKASRPGKTFGPGATMTRDEAEAVLVLLVAEEYGPPVARHYGKPVPQHVYDQGCSTVFNCGAVTLGDRWAASAKAGRYAEAGKLLKGTRVTARGKKLAGLVRRRAEEALLLDRGIYTGVKAPLPATPADPMADGMLIRKERGPAVRELIDDLAALGLYDGVRDDVFGFGTEAAVLAFQRANGLKADGYAGPKTLAAIKAAVASLTPPAAPIPAPKSEPSPTPAPEPERGFWAWLASLFTTKKD